MTLFFCCSVTQDPGPTGGGRSTKCAGIFLPTLGVIFVQSVLCVRVCIPLGMDKRGSVGWQDVMGFFPSRSPLYVLRCLKWIEFDLSMGKGSPFRLPSTEVD